MNYKEENFDAQTKDKNGKLGCRDKKIGEFDKNRR